MVSWTKSGQLLVNPRQSRTASHFLGQSKTGQKYLIIYSFKDQDRANLYLELLDDDMGPFSGETVIHFVIFILGTLGFLSNAIE